MQSRSYYFLLLVLGLGVLFGFLYTKSAYQYGLDVQGGTRLTYKMKFDDNPVKAAEERKNIDEIRANVRRVLQNRVSSAIGVVEGTVQVKGDDQFVVELPGYQDVATAEKTLGTSASIKMYWGKNLQTEKKSYRRYRSEPSQNDVNGNPYVSFSDGSRIIDPKNPQYKEIIAGWGEPILSGSDLSSAQPEMKGEGYIPLLHFSAQGSTKIEAWCRQHVNEGENLCFVLDGVVLNVAPLAPNAIITDSGVIEGNYSVEYVKSFTALLNSGALPVDLEKLSGETIDPTIGKYALGQIVTSGLIAFGIISLFLIAYYSLPGFVAFIALSLYVLFTLTTLKLINATFSLAGIAGFILSVGMAVDANILVFERFKEEIKNGKALKSAMELGFRRALPAIIDSNMCTILTSLVLVNLGTGPVKGFATTLIIGVGISLFTAVAVTRSLLLFMVGSGIANNVKMYATNRSWFGKLEARADHEPLQVVEKWKKWFIISGITIAVGVPFAFMGGFKLNVEFRGGVEAQYTANDATMTAEQITRNLETAGYKGSNVKFSTDQAKERIAILTLADSPDFKVNLTDNTKPIVSPDDIKAKIAKAAGLTGANRGFTQIGPQIQGETINNAILGVIISSLLIVVYLAFRFGFSVGGFLPGLRFGVSAIGALVHDILVVIFLAAFVGYFMHWEISALFLTAMLTIIGFSVHDTIVIFDRIRENLRRPGAGEDFGHLMDRSITQSFARSINTSMTVIVTLAILVFFGTATVDLKFFCVAMLVGIISGTYSSIYNASPILYLWDKMVERSKGPEHTLVGMALSENARVRVIATRAPTEPEAPRRVTPTPTAPTANKPVAPQTGQGGRTYGQVKRRANQPKPRAFDDDDE